MCRNDVPEIIASLRRRVKITRNPKSDLGRIEFSKTTIPITSFQVAHPPLPYDHRLSETAASQTWLNMGGVRVPSIDPLIRGIGSATSGETPVAWILSQHPLLGVFGRLAGSMQALPAT